MMTKLTAFVKNHFLLGKIVKIIIYFILILLTVYDNSCRIFRKLGICSDERKKNKSLQNINGKKRCFIICTGPSLTFEDLEVLSGEYTFGMNSIPMLYEKTSFRATYYGCIDKGVYDKLKNTIDKYSNQHEKVFINDRIRRSIGGKLKDNWYNISCNVAYHTYDRWFKGNFRCKFSDDAYIGTYNMHSVTHFLIQIAVYMGFKEIYLLGADCNFPKNDKIHFVEHDIPDTTIETARERNISGYLKIKEYTKNHDVRIYNATRGGALEVFERVDLDEVLLSEN